MMSQCAAEEKIAGFVEKLSTLDLQETAPKPAPQQTTVPAFEEQILDIKGSDSLLGEAVGAALTSSVAGIVSRFVPNVGIPQGVVVGIAGYFLGKKVFKTGIAHAATRGVTIAALSTVIFPFVGGLAGSLGGAPTSGVSEGAGMPYGV